MGMDSKTNSKVQRLVSPRRNGAKSRLETKAGSALPKYEKVTVYLHPSQIQDLDKTALAILKQIGLRVDRPELIRSLVDHAMTGLDPARKDFGKTVHKLLVG